MMNLAVARKHFEKLEKWEISESAEKSKRNGMEIKGNAMTSDIYPPRSAAKNKYG
jgi:hypothetical protein